MGKTVIGKYIRLSQADRDLMKKENKTESESVSHQRDLIQHFIDSSVELSECEQYEFFDDGFSGTNFDRPSFERLIEKIKSGTINCVVVKDFSRFGRDYIELGDYLERIFPFLGVRFISVNDHYDSNDYKGTTGGLDVVMKNIVYDYYSKDLSVKVSTAKRSKAKQGLYLGGHVPYGLKKHDTIKGKLAIDEEAAAVVRKIFDYALEGYGTADIATKLNEEHILTPGQYYCKKHPDHKKFKNQSSELGWNLTMILKILRQEMYYGAVVGHKREYVMPCSKVSRAVPKSEQIIIEGKHEAIVSKEEWQRAQEVIRKVKSPVRASGMSYALKGVARCGCCGRAVQFYDKQKKKYFMCNASKQNPDASCYQGKIMAAHINNTVWESLKVVLDCADNLDKKIKASQKDKGVAALEYAEKIADLRKALERCKRTRLENLELMNEGKLSKDDFLVKRERINSEIEGIEGKIAEYEDRIQKISAVDDPETARLKDALDKYSGSTELTNDMVRAFIDQVLMFEPGKIEIRWNFSDKLMQMLLEE